MGNSDKNSQLNRLMNELSKAKVPETLRLKYQITRVKPSHLTELNRSDQKSGPVFHGERELALFYYSTPDSAPSTTQPALLRWVVVPERLPISEADRKAYKVFAVAMTPITLIHDVFVVPVEVLIVLVVYSLPQ
jgi:hypothetical protein